MTDAAEPRPGKLHKEVPIEWAISHAGEPLIRLPEGLPAGTYQADSAESFSRIMDANAKRAKLMAEVRKWLLDADVDREKVNDLLLRLNKKADDSDINEALTSLLGLGGRL